jgi:predicted enzyme related to lactoylglutathione lyase
MITSANTSNLPGWLDLGSPDPGASADFYRQTFGWTAELQPGGDPGYQYYFFKKDGQSVAGLGSLMDPSAQPDWMIYTRVADARATAAKAEGLGAKVRVPFMEIGPVGGFAQLTDPVGAEFSLWQPGGMIGFDRCCEDDSLLWVELWTRDPAAARDFYPALFGWQVQAFPMPEGSYDLWTTDPDDQFASFGGIMAVQDGMPYQDEKWIPYFMVADPDATVARAVDAGGKVVMPPEDTPPGRIAALTDQFGARFSIIKPAPME